MFSAGFLGTPGIGYIQDYYAAHNLSNEAPAIHQQYAAPEAKRFLFFEATGLDGKRVVPLMEKPEAELSDPEKSVRSAVIFGARMSLKWTALVPFLMAVGYLLLILYFRAKGGYQQIHLQRAEGAKAVA